MTAAIVIRGTYDGRAFIPAEPLPDTAGRAELIVIPDAATPPTTTTTTGHSFWDAVGKLPPELQRSAEDIDAQIREERDSWGDR